jgi:hypothetical protein
MITVVLGGGLLILAALNCWSTVTVARDATLTKLQKALQVLLIWLLPILGAVAIMSVRHFASRQKDRASADSSLVVADKNYIDKGYF